MTVPGEAPVLVPDVTDVLVDDIVFDYERVKELTPDLPASLARDRQEGYVLYAARPGNAKTGTVQFTRHFGNTKEFPDWRNMRQSVIDGNTARTSITIHFKNHAGDRVVHWIFDECEPVLWELSPDGQTEMLTCEIGRITFAAREPSAPALSGVAPGVGNTPPVGVSFRYADGTASPVMPWDSWSGGEPAILNKLVFQGTKYHEDMPGSLSVEPLTLTGPLTEAHLALYEWLNRALNGNPWVQSLNVVVPQKLPLGGSIKGSVKRQYSYLDGFPIRYTFPRLSVTNTTGNVTEEVTFKLMKDSVIQNIR